MKRVICWLIGHDEYVSEPYVPEVQCRRCWKVLTR